MLNDRLAAVGAGKPIEALTAKTSASKYVSPFWLTMRQANELGGHVRKGEESTAVVFWKIDDVKQSTEDVDNEETGGKTRRWFLLRFYRVWNLEQMRASASRA
jgi:antirestriction protein ArdC